MMVTWSLVGGQQASHATSEREGGGEREREK